MKQETSVCLRGICACGHIVVIFSVILFGIILIVGIFHALLFHRTHGKVSYQ